MSDITSKMSSERTIVDQIHIFNDDHFIGQKDCINREPFCIVKENNSNRLFYQIKKGEEFNSPTKNLFIKKCELSFELIHTSILNLSGFSINKPYLYYKYIVNWHDFKDLKLSDENIQKAFLGIASGLSYLLSKNFYYSNFSIDSIIFDKNDNPKLFDYINLENSNKLQENDLIIKYVDIVNMIINKKKEHDSEIVINDKLISLIKKCQQKTSNLPTFEDFITFFKTTSYNANHSVSIDYYIEYLNYTDKFIYDKEIQDISKNYKIKYESIEQICFFLYGQNPIGHIEYKYCHILNSLPKYYIKQIFNYWELPFLQTMKYLNFDDFSNNNNNPFKIYLELKEQMAIIKDELIGLKYHDKKRLILENKIEKIRIQSIHLLKKASNEPNNIHSKIELAIQYIKGSELPYNLKKASNILDSIKNPDEKTQKIINEIQEKIKQTNKNSSIQNIFVNLSQNQQKYLINAENGNILYQLFVGFAFFCGFNEFPIIRPLSIHYYRKAARKSPYAMCLLGYLYFKGIIFPRNFIRAKNCFRRSAENGYVKAEIIDCYLRKHLDRTYILQFEINKIFNDYLPSFNSMFPNDGLVIPQMIYKYEHRQTKLLYIIELEKDKNHFHSENEYEMHGMFFKLNSKYSDFDKEIETTFSEKVLLSSEKDNKFDINKLSKDDLCKIAKSYYYGFDGYPINYSDALNFFKLAADKGDSEAQLHYALMVENNVGKLKDSELVKQYLKKSSKLNNLQGKLLYSLFLYNNGDYNKFQRHIIECYKSGNLDAIYYYAMYLENDDKSLNQSLHYYKKAADKGHLDSLIRLIYLLICKSQTNLYEEYLNLSVSLLNEHFLVKLINFYDKKGKYGQSNILIQIGVMLNYKLFNAYYSDHLLFGKGMKANIKKAENLANMAMNEYNDEDEVYKERYVYVILEIFIMKNEHCKAALFLIKHKKIITTKYRNKFLSFYQKLDKNIAQYYYITANFCDEKYKEFHSILMDMINANNNKNILSIYSRIYISAQVDGNPYAMVMLGKIHKEGKFIIRDLKKAVQLFTFAAKKKCPEGYYYIGKEYFYGRILDQNFDVAYKFFLLALYDNREPRSGYYIYKIPRGAKFGTDVDDVEALKISAYFGYKRALYKYGKLLFTGKNSRIDIDKPEGFKLINQSAEQGYNKAIKLCKSLGIYNMKKIINYDSISDENNLNSDKEIKNCSVNTPNIESENLLELYNIDIEKNNSSVDNKNAFNIEIHEKDAFLEIPSKIKSEENSYSEVDKQTENVNVVDNDNKSKIKSASNNVKKHKKAPVSSSCNEEKTKSSNPIRKKKAPVSNTSNENNLNSNKVKKSPALKNPKEPKKPSGNDEKDS